MKRYLLTGLLIWAPLGLTVWVLVFIVGLLDQTLLLLPPAWRPSEWLGFNLPGTGVALTFVVLLLTGILATNLIGQSLVRYWEGLLVRIPIFSSLYKSIKQVSDTLLSSSGQAFRQTLLIEYPRRGAWTIAFLTGQPGDGVLPHLPDCEHISVYVPTTPNPTSGFFLMVPKSEVKELDISVDKALKYIISMGSVSPLDDDTREFSVLPPADRPSKAA